MNHEVTSHTCTSLEVKRRSARAPRLRGIGLDEATAMTLSELIPWVKGVPDSLPQAMRPMAKNICESFLDTSVRLIDLGLGYLSLDRPPGTLWPAVFCDAMPGPLAHSGLRCHMTPRPAPLAHFVRKPKNTRTAVF